MDPIPLFEQWFSEELKQSNLDLPAACCLSTLSEDGYPNARFVSLKKITETSFVITGPMDSRKGKEVAHSPKAALTFWWTTTKRQVRIQGDVSKIPEAEAAIYFQERHKDAKIVSSVFDQGKTVESIATLQHIFDIEKKKLKTDFIARPEQWSGIYLTPIRIEFMEFKKSRLHQRTLYQKTNNSWKKSLLQPKIMNKKVAYVTDIHLDEEFPASVGVDTRKNWQVILEDIASRGIADIIFGGDIGEEKTNAWFFNQLKDYTVDLSLGNHDNFNTVKKYYTAHANPHKSALYYRREFPFHTAIFLDSSTEVVQEEQLDWLQTAIQTSKLIIVFVHHPILPVNVIMDKRYALKGRERIKKALLAIPNKVTLFCGHYHLEDEQHDKNIHQYITPASSYQVTKSQDEIKVHTNSFGYRILEFKEEEIHTDLIMF